MMTFTTLVKIFFHQIFLQYKVAELDKHFIQQKVPRMQIYIIDFAYHVHDMYKSVRHFWHDVQNVGSGLSM